MYIEPDVDRQRELKGLSKKDIGHGIMYCPKCDFQFETGIGCKPICLECGARLHITTVTQELLDLIDNV